MSRLMVRPHRPHVDEAFEAGRGQHPVATFAQCHGRWCEVQCPRFLPNRSRVGCYPIGRIVDHWDAAVAESNGLEPTEHQPDFLAKQVRQCKVVGPGVGVKHGIHIEEAVGKELVIDGAAFIVTTVGQNLFG